MTLVSSFSYTPLIRNLEPAAVRSMEGLEVALEPCLQWHLLERSLKQRSNQSKVHRFLLDSNISINLQNVLGFLAERNRALALALLTGSASTSPDISSTDNGNAIPPVSTSGGISEEVPLQPGVASTSSVTSEKDIEGAPLSPLVSGSDGTGENPILSTNLQNVQVHTMNLHLIVYSFKVIIFILFY